MKNILKVRMLGGFTLEYKGKELVLDRNNVSKTTQLFQLLLLHTQDGGISKAALIDALYGRSDVENKNGSLNNTIFRLRKQLTAIVNVCIDNIDGVERSGRFYCYYSKDPIFFRSIHELFRYMERFMNELNFPQSSTELRTYEDKQQKPANEKRISFTEVSNREQILEQRGSIDTLAVYVRYRQNATWQGSVYHMKNNEREDFNSELDLLKIIENCQNSTKNVAESG